MLRQLFKKSLLYFFTLVGGKLLTAVFFIILARILQPEKFGLITYFVTLVQLISVLADLGLKQWYQKKMAQKKNPLLFSQFFTLRLMLFSLSALIIIFGQVIFQILPVTFLAPLLMALILEALISVADGHYLAQNQSLFLGYKLIARNLVLFFALFFIRQPENYQLFFWFYNLAIFSVLLFYFPFQALDWSWLKKGKRIINPRSALPYAIIDDLGIIYSKADSLLIKNFLGSAALGVYGAAYRYLDGFNLVPQALFHNLFPLAAKEKGISYRQVKKMVAVMTALGFFIGGFIFIFSDFLTTFLMGESYRLAGEVLRYFSMIIVLFFFNAPLNTIIQSSPKVKVYAPLLALAMTINIISNLLLIPPFGILGAVYAKILTEVLLIFINLYLISQLKYLAVDNS